MTTEREALDTEFLERVRSCIVEVMRSHGALQLLPADIADEFHKAMRGEPSQFAGLRLSTDAPKQEQPK